MKDNSITDYAISSLTTMSSLILNTRFNLITNYADFRDYIQYISNNFTSLYTNYADFQYQIRNNFISDYSDYDKFRDYL